MVIQQKQTEVLFTKTGCHSVLLDPGPGGMGVCVGGGGVSLGLWRGGGVEASDRDQACDAVTVVTPPGRSSGGWYADRQ